MSESSYVDFQLFERVSQSLFERTSTHHSIVAETGLILSSTLTARAQLYHPQIFLYLEPSPFVVSSADAEVNAVLRNAVLEPIMGLGQQRFWVEILPDETSTIEASASTSLFALAVEQALTIEMSRRSPSLERSYIRDDIQAHRVIYSRSMELVDFMFDSVWETGPDHRFTYVSEQNLIKLGLTKDLVLGKTRLEFVVPFLVEKDEEAWAHHHHLLASHQDFKGFTYSIKTDIGRVLHMEINGCARFDQSGRFLGHLGVAHDISERVQMGKVLQTAEERFSKLAEYSHDWLWEMDEALRFSFLSNCFHESEGIACSDVLGKTRPELVGEATIAADPERWEAHFLDLQHHRPFRNFEYTLIKPNSGDVAIITITGTPYYDEQGAFAGYIGTGSDITHLKHAQEQLIRGERLASLSGVVAGIAHEINTPVGVGVTAISHLQNSTEAVRAALVKESLSVDTLEVFLGDVQTASVLVQENLQRMAELINSFKRLAIVQHGNDIRTFEVLACIDEALLANIPQVDYQQYDIHIRCEKNITMFSAPGALSEVLSLLIGNTLVHAFEDELHRELYFDVYEQGGYMYIQYADNGQGMAIEASRSAFDPFFTTKRSEYSGLGLYLAHKLVKDVLEGDISCYSAPSQGCQFQMRLPTHLNAATSLL